VRTGDHAVAGLERGKLERPVGLDLTLRGAAEAFGLKLDNTLGEGLSLVRNFSLD
jgi:hypothetical protein